MVYRRGAEAMSASGHEQDWAQYQWRHDPPLGCAA